MSMAASPTAFIAIEEKRKGSMPPTKTPAITSGLEMSIPVMLACLAKAANSASAVMAAEPMAKPLPMAAVVLPTASSLSVRSRTAGS
jgi:ABC-type spermidine/putrescine transport system permease subunit I